MAESQRDRITRKNQAKDWRAFTPEARIYFLDELRQARLIAPANRTRYIYPVQPPVYAPPEIIHQPS